MKIQYIFLITIMLIITRGITGAGESPNIWMAARQGDMEKVKKALDLDDRLVNAKDNAGFTPLHFAVLGNHKDVVKLLIHRYANVNARNKSNNTPLHFAASIRPSTGKSAIEIMEILLRNGANINAHNVLNETPLHMAVSSNDLEAVKFLVKKGANLNVKNKSGYTPLKTAELILQNDIATYLKSKGAKK